MQEYGIPDIMDFFDTGSGRIRLSDTGMFFVQVDDRKEADIFSDTETLDMLPFCITIAH